MRSTAIARELIAAILRPSATREPLIRLALALEEALNLESGSTDAEIDLSTERFRRLEFE